MANGLFSNNMDRRDRRMAIKKKIDNISIQNYLKQLEDSYQPSSWKGYLDTITNIGKLAPSPFIKGASYATDFVTDFVDSPRYDTSNAPNVMFGQSIIDENKKKSSMMNQLLKERMWTDAIQTASEFGFKEVKIKDPNDKDGKMIGSGKSLYDMLLEKFRFGGEQIKKELQSRKKV